MIDFHCHLDLYDKPETLVEGCDERGMYVLSVTTTPAAWEGTRALAQSSKRIRTALGMHPQLVGQRKAELPLFERLLPEARYVGEIGLDGSPEFKETWDDQLVVFEKILELCAHVGGRIMSIHTRRSAAPTIDRLANSRASGVPVLHWFSGTLRDLRRADDLGCWFSVGPSMLQGEKGRDLVSRMPRDRLLTESDGPFAQINGRPAYPWEVSTAADGLANLWGVSRQVVDALLLDNLRRLVGARETAG